MPAAVRIPYRRSGAVRRGSDYQAFRGMIVRHRSCRCPLRDIRPGCPPDAAGTGRQCRGLRRAGSPLPESITHGPGTSRQRSGTGRRSAQETFLRVYRARKSYSPNAKFVTWLFTIATNLASNARRQKSRRKEIVLASSGQEQSTGIDLASLALAASGLMPTHRSTRPNWRKSCGPRWTHSRTSNEPPCCCRGSRK